jgi:TPR repeat protein
MYDDILALTALELYNQALYYKQHNYFDNYCIYMNMSANLNYELAEKDILDDIANTKLYREQDYKNTIEFYKYTRNYKWSSFWLGHIYYYGKGGVLVNYIKTKEYYEISVNLGNHVAMQRLGLMYQDGTGGLKNPHMARQLYEQAIAQGNSIAMNNLAYMYHHGELVTDALQIRDLDEYRKARDLYEMAILNGSQQAITNLIKLYNTKDIKVDKDHAIKFFLKIKKPEIIKELYNLDQDYMKLLEENYKLKNEIDEDLIKLITENDKLKRDVEDYRLGVKLFEAIVGIKL